MSAIRFTLNGGEAEAHTAPAARLSQALREEFGLTGTKVGCDAGDCGACTVLLDGEPVCACLTAVGQVAGARVETIEGLSRASEVTRRLQDSFLAHGAAQCGICTPGMLVAATHLLERTPHPSGQEAMDAIGGVLCRCTGYRKIVAAVCAAGSPVAAEEAPAVGGAVGARLRRLDGRRKVEGTDIFGADEAPADCLLLRAVRSPFHRARFRFGDLDAFVKAHPGIHRVLTAKDVPGVNRYGVIPAFA
ncbi:MAG TPA: 2Fe-2S iron-sulfur cluster-binding protein, partial [Alphaproteobacteria bacterium]